MDGTVLDGNWYTRSNTANTSSVDITTTTTTTTLQIINAKAVVAKFLAELTETSCSYHSNRQIGIKSFQTGRSLLDSLHRTNHSAKRFCDVTQIKRNQSAPLPKMPTTATAKSALPNMKGYNPTTPNTMPITATTTNAAGGSNVHNLQHQPYYTSRSNSSMGSNQNSTSFYSPESPHKLATLPFHHTPNLPNPYQHHLPSHTENMAGIGEGTLNKQELNGLNIAGVAVTLLTTVFTLFHPMFIVHIMLFSSSYSSSSTSSSAMSSEIVPMTQEEEAQAIGAALIPEQNQQELIFEKQHLDSNQQQQNQQQTTVQKLLVFCIINPLLVLSLSWLIDYYWCYQKNRKRTDLISVSGCIFAISCTIPFLVPLLIPNFSNGNIWSMSLYDISYFSTTIILTSALTECYNMTTRSKMSFMLSSEVMYLLVSVITCQFGLPHFYVSNEQDRSTNIQHVSAPLNNNETDANGGEAREDDAIEMDAGPTAKTTGSIGGFCTFLLAVVLIACTLFVLAQTLITTASLISLSSAAANNANNNNNKRPTLTTKLNNAKPSNLHLQHLHDDTNYESDDDTVEIERAITAAAIAAATAGKVTTVTKIRHIIQRNISSFLSWNRRKGTLPLYITPTIHHQIEWTKRIAIDIWKHKNFCIWLVTEMLLKAQNSFISYFLYLFMGRMVAGQASQIFHHHLASTTTFSNFGTIFLISLSKQIVTILAYIPIALLGYRQVYQYMFDVAIGLSIFGFLFADPTSDMWIVGYTFVYTTMTRAIHNASIYLAMSDMVLEMKHKHTVCDHRGENEPPVAALYLGLNTLFAQPTRVVFAIFAEIVADSLHQRYHGSSNDDPSFTTDESKRSVFRCIVVTTFICSILQMIAWNRYDLRPRRVAKIRDELKYFSLPAPPLLQSHPSNIHHTRHDSSGSIPLEIIDHTKASSTHHTHHQQTLLHRQSSNRELQALGR